MSTEDKKDDKKVGMLKDEDVNKTLNEGNKVPNIHPTPKSPGPFSDEEIEDGRASGAPSQKSGSRGAADVQDGGPDVGSSAGSH